MLLLGLTATANAQSGEWKEWSSARYYWETDRSELEAEREQNLSVRDRLGLVPREYQSDTAGLTPAPLGVTRVNTARADVRPVVTPQPQVNPPRDDGRRRAEEERRRAEEEQRLAEEERRRAAVAQQGAEKEQRRRAAEEERRRAAEEKRKRIEAEKQAIQERQAKLERAKAQAIARKREEFEARKNKAKKKAKAKKIEKEVLTEDTNKRGQVVDSEIQNILDEIVE